MLTDIYFVRDAQSDLSIRQEDIRPLTEVGHADAKRVTAALLDKGISRVYSSPFVRCVDTVRHFADAIGVKVITVDDFRERCIGDWVDDFTGFSKRQWEDFDYRHPDGESLREVQDRNIKALNAVLTENTGRSAAIGTHGTALSTIMNFYDPTFGYDGFYSMIGKTPYILHFQFVNTSLKSIKEVVFEPQGWF